MRGYKHLGEFMMAMDHRMKVDPPFVPKGRGMILEVLDTVVGDARNPLKTTNDTKFRARVAPWLRTLRIATQFEVPWDGLEESLRFVESQLPRIEEYIASLSRVDMRWALQRSLHILGMGAMPDLEGEVHEMVVVDWPTTRWVGQMELLTKRDAYTVVHEVFEATNEVGDAPVGWSEGRVESLTIQLGKWIPELIALKNTDLLAETLDAIVLLGGDLENPQVALGMGALLTQQQSNGAFGDYEEARALLASEGLPYDVDVGQYLHTTEVALWLFDLLYGPID